MQSSAANAKAQDEASLQVKISSAAELRDLELQFIELKDRESAPQITHLSVFLDQLPFGGGEEGQRISAALCYIFSRLAETASFTSLSLSCHRDNPHRLDWWTLDSPTPVEDITSTLSLRAWSHRGHAQLPRLSVSGLSQVPAHAMYAWMTRSSALSLENVTLDYSTFAGFQMPPIGEDHETTSAFQQCSLKLRPLGLANFIHFHRDVLGQRSPLLELKSLELWAGRFSKNGELAGQFFTKGSRAPQSLEHFAFYRWFDKDICGDSESSLSLSETRTPLSNCPPSRCDL
jgi:hypothetical protein